MKKLMTRRRIVGRTAPVICLAVVVAVILLKAAIGLGVYRRLDVFDLVIHLALAAGLFYVVTSGPSPLWTIVDGAVGVRMERDGSVLYEGPISNLRVVDEDRGIMTLRSEGGDFFHFPRCRVFHPVLSRIQIELQPEGGDTDGNP